MSGNVHSVICSYRITHSLFDDLSLAAFSSMCHYKSQPAPVCKCLMFWKGKVHFAASVTFTSVLAKNKVWIHSESQVPYHLSNLFFSCHACLKKIQHISTIKTETCNKQRFDISINKIVMWIGLLVCKLLSQSISYSELKMIRKRLSRLLFRLKLRCVCYFPIYFFMSNLSPNTNSSDVGLWVCGFCSLPDCWLQYAWHFMVRDHKTTSLCICVCAYFYLHLLYLHDEVCLKLRKTY